MISSENAVLISLTLRINWQIINDFFYHTQAPNFVTT